MEKNVCQTHALKLRWINAQCFEFKFSNGKTLLTDPFFDVPELFKEGQGLSLMNFHVDDLQGADYIFINHTHGDHIANLQQVYDRFHSTVICHSAVAMEIAKSYCIPLTSIYPVDFNGRYYFDGFTLDTYHGTHHPQPRTYPDIMQHKHGFGRTENTNELNAMGGIFNVNFIMTLPEGLRIAFVGGNDDGMAKRFRESPPNLLIRNKMGSSRDFDHVAERFADIFARSSTQMLIPMHCETWVNERPEFMNSVIDDMNHIMEKKELIGRIKLLDRTKWYYINLSISEACD